MRFLEGRERLRRALPIPGPEPGTHSALRAQHPQVLEDQRPRPPAGLGMNTGRAVATELRCTAKRQERVRDLRGAHSPSQAPARPPGNSLPPPRARGARWARPDVVAKPGHFPFAAQIVNENSSH